MLEKEVSIETLCTKHNEHIDDIKNEPPYDKNGNGTPVNGIIPNKPPKLIKI